METILKNDPELNPKQRDESLMENVPPLTVTRMFNAPVEAVWKAWTDEDLVKQWWGPEGYTSPSAKIDFRVGGRYIYAMKDSSGKIIWSSGVYKEIIPNKKIVCTDNFSDELGNTVSPSEYGMKGEWPTNVILTVKFEVVNSGVTQMVIIHDGIPLELHRECIEGWNSSINKLKQLVDRH